MCYGTRHAMLKWLFGKSKPAAERGDDHVWTTGTARQRGVVRLATAAAGEGRGVVVVVPARGGFDETMAALSPLGPTGVIDVRGRSALRDGLGRVGAAFVALAGELPTDVTPLAAGSHVAILVVGREAERAADDVLVAFADALGPGARITFHLTLEDPLLRGFDTNVGELLARLGASDDEPIVHAFVTKAIARAQARG